MRLSLRGGGKMCCQYAPGNQRRCSDYCKLARRLEGEGKSYEAILVLLGEARRAAKEEGNAKRAATADRAAARNCCPSAAAAAAWTSRL